MATSSQVGTEECLLMLLAIMPTYVGSSNLSMKESWVQVRKDVSTLYEGDVESKGSRWPAAFGERGRS